jgi:hypothetical protein
MRSYSFSYGPNEPLRDIKFKEDVNARIHALRTDAEYCVRTKGYRGPAKYTVVDYVEKKGNK